jgi:predicted TIM-barrel fold metal-dependent hydrolase
MPRFSALLRLLSSGLILLTCARLQAAIAPPPAADHHIHIASARAAEILGPTSTPHSAKDIIKILDDSHIEQAAVLSAAYRFGAASVHLDHEAEEVDRENAWAAAQAAEFPTRLTAFCSVNPIKPYALAAIDHCAALGIHGLKLHMANSGFNYDNPAHIASLKAVFAKANSLHMAILIHLRNGVVWNGAHNAGIFLDEVLPVAPDVTVQLAHLSGWGGYDRSTDEGLSTFASRCEREPKRCERLYFDLAAVFLADKGEEAQPAMRATRDAVKAFPQGPEAMAKNIRKLGLQHMLFATDYPVATPVAYIPLLLESLKLSPVEIDTIFKNTAPYLGGK